MGLSAISSNPPESFDSVQKNVQVPSKPVSVFDRASDTLHGMACMATIYSGFLLANSTAHYLLGTCQSEMGRFDDNPFIRDYCTVPNENFLFAGKISLACFAGSLAISSLPSVINKIKNLSIFNKKSVSNDIKTFVTSNAKKNSEAESLPSVGLLPTLGMGFLVGGIGTTFKSLYHFSEAGVRSLFGRCTIITLMEKVENSGLGVYKFEDFACKEALQNGYAGVVTAGILFTAGVALLNSERLIGRVKKLFS